MNTHIYIYIYIYIFIHTLNIYQDVRIEDELIPAKGPIVCAEERERERVCVCVCACMCVCVCMCVWRERERENDERTNQSNLLKLSTSASNDYAMLVLLPLARR